MVKYQLSQKVSEKIVLLRILDSCPGVVVYDTELAGINPSPPPPQEHLELGKIKEIRVPSGISHTSIPYTKKGDIADTKNK